jgi:hypothetical protein
MSFSPSFESECTLHCNVNRGQETPSGSNNQEWSVTLKRSCNRTFGVSTSFCPGNNDFSKHWSKANVPRQSTLATKDLFQSKSGKETNLDIAKAKNEKI